MTAAETTLWLLRHGETEWSAAGRHTGRTDVPLTPLGERQAGALAARLRGREFAVVLTSPLARARETCRLAGLGAGAEVVPDLQEWDYGELEGMTTPEIQAVHSQWSVWENGGPGGESPEDVARRADRVIARLTGVPGDVALFAHGHLLRVLAARWLDLPPRVGAGLILDTASVSVLGQYKGYRVIRHWNEICHLAGH